MEDKILLNERKRLKELQSFDILDTPAESAYDDIVKLASEICETPVALVTLIDGERQWFKSKIGIEVEETPRAVAFCSHAILHPQELLLVEDAEADERFAENPLVKDAPHIRFYAGAPLVTDSGEALGTLCVIDDKPRELSEKQKLALRVLARQIVVNLNLRRAVRQAREVETRFEAFMNNSPTVAYMKDEAGRLVYINKNFESLFKLEASRLLGKTDSDYLPSDVAEAVRKNDALVLSEWKPMELLEEIPSADGAASRWISLKFPFTDTDGAKFLGGVSIDVTARLNAEEKLNQSEQRYRHLFELSPGYINVHDLNGAIISVNEAATNALGYQADEVSGRNLTDFLIPESRPFFNDYLERIRLKHSDEGIFYILTKGGEQRAWQYRNRLFQEEGSSYVLGYAQDITDLKQVQKRLRDLTLTDDLTHLYNRRGFFTLAEQALRFARRTKKDCVIIYADLDNLKKINDQFGHAAGSQMIVDAANIFKSSFRDSDIVARIGGDEFVILAQDSSIVGAETITERLRKKIEAFNLNNPRPLPLSASFGIVPFPPESTETIEDIVSEADKLMYLQKQAKHNRSQNQTSAPPEE